MSNFGFVKFLLCRDLAHCFSPVTFAVDPDLPEQNPTCGHVIALKAKNFRGRKGSKHEGKEFDGFYILAKAEKRWYDLDDTQDHIMLTMSSSSELLLKIPAWDFDLLNSRDDIPLMKNYPKSREFEGIVDALDNAHSKLSKVHGAPDPRQYMYLKMQFKAPVRLSGEVLYDQFEEDLLVPLCAKIKFVSDHIFFVWKVARIDTESFKKGKHTPKTKKSAGAAMMDSDSDDEGRMDEY